MPCLQRPIVFWFRLCCGLPTILKIAPWPNRLKQFMTVMGPPAVSQHFPYYLTASECYDYPRSLITLSILSDCSWMLWLPPQSYNTFCTGRTHTRPNTQLNLTHRYNPNLIFPKFCYQALRRRDSHTGEFYWTPNSHNTQPKQPLGLSSILRMMWNLS